MERKGKEFWHRTIQRWKNSGESQNLFCKKNNLKLSTFQLWKRKIDSSRENFVELKKPAISNASEKFLELNIFTDGTFELKFHPSQVCKWFLMLKNLRYSWNPEQPICVNRLTDCLNWQSKSSTGCFEALIFLMRLQSAGEMGYSKTYTVCLWTIIDFIFA